MKKESFELCEGDILIVPPNIYHSSHSEENAVKRSAFFTFEKRKSKEESEPIYAKVSSAFSEGFHFLKGDGYTSALLSRISDGYPRDAIGSDYRMRASAA